MTSSTRERRLQNEGAYLRMLCELNVERLRFERHYAKAGSAVFEVQLMTPAHDRTQHRIQFIFPEYFPSVPIEAYLEIPVRHPNVHPESGFICLWSRHSAGDTIVEALLQTQRVISGQLWNREADHLMQPDAVDPIPLPFEPLRVPASYYLDRSSAHLPEGRVRRRLSPLE